MTRNPSGPFLLVIRLQPTILDRRWVAVGVYIQFTDTVEVGTREKLVSSRLNRGTEKMRSEIKEAGASAPLLPDVQFAGDEVSDGASISSAIFNVSTSMIGAGIMSIPATFKVLGVIPSFLVILILAFFVEVTVEFLLKYTRHSGDLNSYGGLMAESFGKPGAVALQVCVLLTNLGAMIIYLIIIGTYKF